jgi:hypothetical protein
VDHHVDVLDLILKPLTVLTDDLQIEIIVVHGLIFNYFVFIAEDIGQQLIFLGFKLIKERFEGSTDSELPICDRLDEVGRLEEEV